MDSELEPMKIGSSQGQRARSVASETVSGRGGGLVGLLLLLRHRWGNVRSGVVVVAATIVIVTVVLLYPQMSTGVGSPVGEGGDSMAAATALAGADASTSMGAPGGAGGYDLGESIHGAYRAALVSDASGLPPLVPLALQAPEFVTSDGGIEFTVLRPKAGAPTRQKPRASSFDPFAAAHLERALVVTDIPSHPTYTSSATTSSASSSGGASSSSSTSSSRKSSDTPAEQHGRTNAVSESTHTVVLNKYASFEDHALIITRSFEPQTALLTRADLSSWLWAVTEARAVGFYNSDAAAGASQPHKHLQMIPTYVLKSLRRPGSKYSFPLEDVVTPFLEPQRTTDSSISGMRRVWSKYDPRVSTNRVYAIKSLPFRHSVLALLPRSNFSQQGSGSSTSSGSGTGGAKDHKLSSTAEAKELTYEDYLYSAYLYLMRTAQLLRAPTSTSSSTSSGTTSSSNATSCFLQRPVAPVLAQDSSSSSSKGQGKGAGDSSACVPYNLIVTPSWMFVVPRSSGGASASISGGSSSSSSSVIDINGIGFLGFVLVRDPTIDAQSISPLDLLRRASAPR